jgi:hypothetical protein
MCRSGSACGCGGGGSGLAAVLAVVVAVVAAAVVFVAAHVAVLAVAVAVFAGGLGGFAVWTRRAARWPGGVPRSPRALRGRGRSSVGRGSREPVRSALAAGRDSRRTPALPFPERFPSWEPAGQLTRPRMTPQEVAAWMLATDHLALERETRDTVDGSYYRPLR